MKKKASHTLKRKMVIYFLLICVASLIVGIEFISDTQEQGLRGELLQACVIYAKSPLKNEDILFSPFMYLRNKAILMVLIILTVIIIILTMFIRNITDPLQHMIEIAEKISRGDLCQSVSIHSKNELAVLGSVINEMSANLQEMILFSKQLCQAGGKITEDLEHQIKEWPFSESDLSSMESGIKTLRREFETMQEMIDHFNFYTIEKNNDS